MYTLTRRETGKTVQMSDGSVQPETYATILEDGTPVTTVRLNATTFCAGGDLGTGKGPAATDEQIIAAVLGDEHVFTGQPTFPEHHDRITQEV